MLAPKDKRGSRMVKTTSKKPNNGGAVHTATKTLTNLNTGKTKTNKVVLTPSSKKEAFKLGGENKGPAFFQPASKTVDPEGNTVKNKEVKFGKNKGKTKSVTKFAKENRPSVGGKRRQKNYY